MNVRYWFGVILAVSLVALASAQPRVFTRGTFPEAMAWSESTPDGMLVVSFGASWCQPCKVMDAQTWQHPNVEEFVKRAGYAIKIDGDKERALVGMYNVRGYPTTMVLRSGEVVARRTGFMDASTTLTWLESLVEVSAEAGSTLSEAWSDVQTTAARDAKAGAEKALDLWERGSLGDDWQGVRLRRSLAGVIASGVATGDDDVTKRVGALRDAWKQGGLDDQGSLELWVVLSTALGETDDISAWFDETQRERRRTKPSEGLTAELVDALALAGRWADSGRLIRDPMEIVERELGIAGVTDEAAREAATGRMAMRIGRVHASLIAARKLRLGWRVLEGVVKAKPSDTALDAVREAMVRAAVDAGVAQPRHRSLLEACAKPDPELGQALSSALD
ncbi:MAG: thioredoxin family protein [Planctomycetota bacterium]